MNIALLRKYIYAFGLPLIWWSSVSSSSPMVGSAPPTDELEFIPVALHASRAADYSPDPFGMSITAIDLSIIKDAVEDRIAIKDLPEIFDDFPEEEVSTKSPQKAQNDSSNENSPVSSSSNPPPSDETNPDDGGDTPPDDPGTDDGAGSGPGNGNGKGKDDHPNNGQGQDKPKDKGKKPNQT